MTRNTPVQSDSDVPALADQRMFDRFLQSAKYVRTQYGMQLSIHEGIVLDTLLRHHTIRAAAQELNITPHTMSNYQHTLLKRFGCTNRHELRDYCQKHGWYTTTVVPAEHTSVPHLRHTTDY